LPGLPRKRPCLGRSGPKPQHQPAPLLAAPKQQRTRQRWAMKNTSLIETSS